MKPLELIIIFDLKYTVKKWCSMCIEESIYFEKDWIFSCKTYSNNPYLQLWKIIFNNLVNISVFLHLSSCTWWPPNELAFIKRDFAMIQDILM